MDPISEQGLADPSLHHGCSTDSTGDWTMIGKKNNLNKNKNKNFNNDNTHVQRDEQVPDKMDGNDTIDMNKGSPPTMIKKTHLLIYMTMKIIMKLLKKWI